MTDRAVSLVLADDHPLVLSGLRRLIESHPRFQVLAECTDGDAALTSIRRLLPTIAVVDLKMPKRNGLSVLSAVFAEELATRVVLLAATIADAEIHTAVECGVDGIVLKEWAPDTLLSCLGSVAAGQRWLPPALVAGAVNRETARRRFAEDVVARLTRREREIALLAADGLSSKQIAQKFELSEGTVKLHLHNLFQKLAVTKRAEMLSIVSRIRDKLEID